jgi:hypothetical protein
MTTVRLNELRAGRCLDPFGQTGHMIVLTFPFALRLQLDCLQAERSSLKFLMLECLPWECASLECLATEPGLGSVKSEVGVVQRFENYPGLEKLTSDTRIAGVET